MEDNKVEEKKMPSPEDILEQAKGKFSNVIVLGVSNGSGAIDILTTNPNYAFLHWMLNKTQLELLLHEKNGTQGQGEGA